MDIRVRLIYDQEEIISNVISIENHEDYFLIIKFKLNDRVLEKVYLISQVVKIDCRL